MAEKGDLFSQIVNGESEDDDIEEDCNTDFEVELLETTNSNCSGYLSNKYLRIDGGLPNEGNLDSPVPGTASLSSNSAVSDSSTTVKSLMDCLHRPTASELLCKRKVDCNQPPKGKKQSRGICSSHP